MKRAMGGIARGGSVRSSTGRMSPVGTDLAGPKGQVSGILSERELSPGFSGVSLQV